MELFKLSTKRSADVAAGNAYIKQLDQQEEEKRAKKAKEYLEEILANDFSEEVTGKYK